MILVKPSFIVIAQSILPESLIEKAGRVCYKSEDKITANSCEPFISGLIKSGHESVLEHASFTVKFICDRGVTHELVRHRIASYSQESTRYCNYKGGMTFVIPPWCGIEEGEYLHQDEVIGLPSHADIYWATAMLEAEKFYLALLKHDWTPQQARSVLPNSLKTEIVTTANVREWRHIFRLRTSPKAHPQMRETMIPLFKHLRKFFPIFFSDIDEPV